MSGCVNRLRLELICFVFVTDVMFFVLRTSLFTHEIVRRGVGHLRSYRKSTDLLETLNALEWYIIYVNKAEQASQGQKNKRRL